MAGWALQLLVMGRTEMVATLALCDLANVLGRNLPPQSGPVSALRDHARVALNGELTWPSSKQESWRYTPVTPLTARVWRRPGKADRHTQAVLPKELAQLEGPCLVFVDGHLAPELSRRPEAQPDIWVGSMAQACAEGLPWLSSALAEQELHSRFGLAALNASTLEDGAVVHVGRNRRLAAPLHLIYLQSGVHATAMVTQPRTLLVAGEHAELTVWEHYVGDPGAHTWTNAITEISLGDGAQMQHITLQNESAIAQHTSAMAVRVGAHAKIEAFVLWLGGLSARREMHVHLNGPGAEAKMAGLYLANASQHHDFQVNVHHDQPHTQSLQNFRGILDDHATGVFSGTVYVAPGAEKTSARQLCRSLLRSAQSRVHVQPRLEILADDVKCAHGATVGQLDREALFYLQSRGFDVVKAIKILTYAFAADVLQDAPAQARAILMQRLRVMMGLDQKMGGQA